MAKEQTAALTPDIRHCIAFEVFLVEDKEDFHKKFGSNLFCHS
jgi:hypothetical protein